MVLKELRLKNGYTQKEVAKAIGVSLSTYRRYENKVESLCGTPVTRIRVLAEFYKVSSDYILSDLFEIVK